MITKAFDPKAKSRAWFATMYTENMIPEWQDNISGVLQYPYSYGIHNKDKDKDGVLRKEHAHIILVYPSPTTGNNVLSILKGLEAEGKSAFAAGHEMMPVINMRHAYDYLIHDTEDARKKGKHLYDKSERITGNGFDIGLYEQVSAQEKQKMRQELARMIYDKNIVNFSDFYMAVVSNYDDVYEDVVSTYSAFFERLTRGNYQRNAPRD